VIGPRFFSLGKNLEREKKNTCGESLLLSPSPYFPLLSFPGPPFTLPELHCSLPPYNRLDLRSSFSNLNLVSSTNFAQPHAGSLCFPTSQRPIGAKQLRLIHHAPANALRLPRPSCCSCLLIFFIVFCKGFYLGIWIKED
jgi:hypothetical protein